MKAEFVTKEIAEALKYIGFNEPCLCYYNIHGDLIPIINHNSDDISTQVIKNTEIETNGYFAAPLHQQAVRFLSNVFIKTNGYPVADNFLFNENTYQTIINIL
jgi:hypothetical protein